MSMSEKARYVADMVDCDMLAAESLRLGLHYGEYGEPTPETIHEVVERAVEFALVHKTCRLYHIDVVFMMFGRSVTVGLAGTDMRYTVYL